MIYQPDRYIELEGTASPHLAPYSEVAAHYADELMADGYAQTRSLLRLLSTACLHEGIEDGVQFIRSDTYAGIFDFEME